MKKSAIFYKNENFFALKIVWPTIKDFDIRFKPSDIIKTLTLNFYWPVFPSGVVQKAKLKVETNGLKKNYPWFFF